MKRSSRLILRLECLEARRTPDVTTVNATTVRFVDVDGDAVTVRVSAGTLTAGLFTTAATGLGDQLQRINLSAGGFDRASIIVSVRKAAGGDGLVNIGHIESTGHDLGAVSIPGDLGQIDAGDGDAAAPALKSLAVRSFGRFGLDTQPAVGSYQSDVIGSLGNLTVRGDMVGAYLFVNDGPDGDIGTVVIGGSLIGTADFQSGRIETFGSIGSVRVGRDVQGGSGDSSGVVSSHEAMGLVFVGGSILGGAGGNSGRMVSLADMGPVRIGRDIRGGTGDHSGFVGGSNLQSVNVGGSIVGGADDFSGEISSSVDMGSIVIGRDLIGGSIRGTTASLVDSGTITGLGRIASVTIGGSIISGTDTSTGGSLTANATVRAGDDIGSLTVRGSVIGNRNANGNSPVIISARGQAMPGLGRDRAIGRITVGGRAEFAQFIAGYNTLLAPKNADAQIGRVTIGRDWVASVLAAGVNPSGDAKISGLGTTDTAGIVSKIAGITIRGQALGTPASVSATDGYGFVSQQIGSLRVGGQSFSLTVGAANDLASVPVGATGDLTVHEIAL